MNVIFYLIALVVALNSIPVSAEPMGWRNSLTGAWAYEEAVTTYDDGRPPTHEYGEHPHGIFVILPNGHYSHIVMKRGRPHVAGGTIKSGTPDENAMMAQGTLAHFGTYVMNEKAGTFTVAIDGASFPNFEGVKQTRTILALTRERLEYINPVSAAGSGARVRAVLRRIPPGK